MTWCRARLQSCVRCALRRPRLSLLLLCVLLLFPLHLLWISAEHEDWFIVLNGHPYTAWMLWNKITGHTSALSAEEAQRVAANLASAPASRRIQPGRLPNIDHVFVVHYAPQTERQAVLEGVFVRDLGLDPKDGYYEFRSEWDGKRVLSDPSFLSSHFFSTASEIVPRGGLIAESRGLAAELDGYEHYPLPEWRPLTGPARSRMAIWRQHVAAWEELLNRTSASTDSDDGVGHVNANANANGHVSANANAHANVLVLENDNVLVEGFASHLQDLWEFVPADYDVLYIGSCLGRHAPEYRRVRGGLSAFVEQINPHVYRMREHRCASGYVMSRSGAAKLLRGTDPSADQPPPPLRYFDDIDEWMQWQMRRPGTDFTNVYWMEPVLSYEGSKSWPVPMYCSRDIWFACGPLSQVAFRFGTLLLVVALGLAAGWKACVNQRWKDRVAHAWRGRAAVAQGLWARLAVWSGAASDDPSLLGSGSSASSRDPESELLLRSSHDASPSPTSSASPSSPSLQGMSG